MGRKKIEDGAPEVAQPVRVEPVEVKAIQPRLTGQPKRSKSGNKTIFNMATNRHVSLPENLAKNLLRTKPNEYTDV